MYQNAAPTLRTLSTETHAPCKEQAMNRKLVGGLIGLAVLGVSTAASTHVDLAVGIGFPGQVYSAPAPVYVAPQPVYVAPQPVYAPAPYVAGPAPVAVGYW